MPLWFAGAPGTRGPAMPLRLDVQNSVQREQLDHAAGPLEFGRGPQRETKRCRIIGDLTVSRDQLQIEERPGGRVRVENLSRHIAVVAPGRCRIAELQAQEFDLPLLLTMGQTRLSIQPAPSSEAGVRENLPPEATFDVPPPQGLLSIPPPTPNAHPKARSWDLRVGVGRQCGRATRPVAGAGHRVATDGRRVAGVLQQNCPHLGRSRGHGSRLGALAARWFLVDCGQCGGLGYDQRALQPDARESRLQTAENLLRGPGPLGPHGEPAGARSRPSPRRSSAFRKTWWACCTACVRNTGCPLAAPSNRWKPNWSSSWRRPWGPTWRGRQPSGRGCSSSSSSRRTWCANSSAMRNCWKAGPTR